MARSKKITNVKPPRARSVRKTQEIGIQTEMFEEVLMNAGVDGLNGMNPYQVNPFGLSGVMGAVGAAPVSEVNTVFANLRWALISNMRQVLDQAYVEIGLVQTIVDVPVDDAMRGGIEIKSKQLDEDEIEQLMVSIDREDDLNVIGQAHKWNRLFGGAGIIVVVADQDPETELDLDSIGPDTEVTFRAADLWELFNDRQNIADFDPAVSSSLHEPEYYTFYGDRLHKSRVMKLKGIAAPSFIRPRLRGWGVSIVEQLVRSINQYLKASDLSFQVLDEFKIDVYKIKNLVSTLMQPNGQQKVQQRIQMANAQKDYQNALVIDSEDDWDHKQLSFSGLAETQEGIRMQVAADMRIPITKLFGTSASGGIGNTDQNDMENYNSMVESQIRNKAKYDVLRVVEIKCQILFGFIPDDLSVSFRPLRVLSAEQEENVKTQKFNRLLQAKSANEISTYEFREACNKGDLFDIYLDNAGEALNPDDPQIETIVTKEAVEPGSSPADEEARGADGGNRGGNKAANSRGSYTKTLIRKNSRAFDQASYEADGGDNWINPDRLRLLREVTHDKPGLWAEATRESQAIYGRENLAFIAWMYQKRGGRL